MNAIQTNKNIMTPVFVNTWGNYNKNGADGGRWLTLPMEPEELNKELAALAAAMGDSDPEWCVHDIDGATDAAIAIGNEFNDYSTPQEINAALLELADLYEYEQLAVLAALEAGCYYYMSEAIENADTIVFHEGATLEEFADELMDAHNVPEEIRQYFDYDAYQRNLEFDGYTEVSNGVVYIG